MLTVKQWTAWTIALGAAAFLLVLATLPPFVGEPYRLLIMESFHAVCHQIPERSPHVAGVPLAVCHRCYGAYAGLVFGVVLFLYAKRWDKVLMNYAAFLLLGAVAVPGADWLAGVTGVWSNTPISRVLTGGVFGIIAGYYLARALAQLGQTAAGVPAPSTVGSGGA